MKVFLLLAIILVVVASAAGKKGKKPSKGKGNGGKEAKCLSDEQARYLCMEGTSLQAKMGPALVKCGIMPAMDGGSVEGSMSASVQTRAKKVKKPSKAKKPAKGKKPVNICKKKCPSMDDIKMEFMESGADDMCFYNAIGWMDDEGEFQKDVHEADIMELPWADRLNQTTIRECGQDMAAEKMAKKYGKCFAKKCYSEEEQELLSEMITMRATMKCFEASADKACANFLESFTKPSCSPLEAWEEAFSNASLVPAKLATMPTAPLIMYWRRSGLKVQPGTEAFTGQMRERPEVAYPTEPNTLYTVMMVDVSIEVEGMEGAQYIHWIVENVPGTMVDLGDEVMEYFPPSSFKVDPTTGNSLIEDGEPLNTYVTLVYKQSSRISMTKRQNGCNLELLTGRMGNNNALAAEYGLEGPIAGNFLRNVYSQATNYNLCGLSRCSGAPFPLPLPGVNDGPHCQADA